MWSNSQLKNVRRHVDHLRWSAMACNIGNSRKDDGYINSGNELILDNQKILYGELDERYGGGGFEVCMLDNTETI